MVRLNKNILPVAVVFVFLLISFVCTQTSFSMETEAEGGVLNVDAKSSILIEASSGKVLYENNADERLAPASVTKTMTILLIYEAVASGKISWDDVVTVSEHAASMGGSQVFLEPNEQQPVRELVKSIVIASANDAAVAMAEFVAGSEESFVALMNERAKTLGCENTHFKNACGLDEDGHYTSARDMAKIAKEIINKHSSIFEFTKTWQDSITHKTRRGEEEFGLTNTNKLIRWYNGATGLKTGSTGRALYCLVGTAEKNDLSLVSVVLAAPTPNIRFQEVMKMLDYGYANFKTAQGMSAGTEAGEAVVTKGAEEAVKASVKSNVCVVVPKASSGELETVINMDSVEAPVSAGDKVGEVIYSYDGKEIGRSDLVAAEDVEKAGFVDVAKRLIKIWR
ncbi:MAG: D-alanyl-D-alanine carboxypeptidase [Clostridiales bacterium]|jgi:D-alanyl-D-alanine carboxypeptidase (penicillin-binding protein 5/6)|nr:D-alanyl-D-alanine carboxypeptidase [Clostridiales bacterium]